MKCKNCGNETNNKNCICDICVLSGIDECQICGKLVSNKDLYPVGYNYNRKLIFACESCIDHIDG